jgi:hypothetical protein
LRRALCCMGTNPVTGARQYEKKVDMLGGSRGCRNKYCRHIHMIRSYGLLTILLANRKLKLSGLYILMINKAEET